MTAGRKSKDTNSNGLAARLSSFRLEKGYTYRRLAALISGVAPNTVRRAELGFHLTKRIAFKIERFLNGVARG